MFYCFQYITVVRFVARDGTFIGENRYGFAGEDWYGLLYCLHRDNEAAFLDYYDEVEICEEAARAHFKAAIQIRNRCMADRSNLVVCCVQRKKGGAYQAVRYAEKMGKEVWNVGK